MTVAFPCACGKLLSLRDEHAGRLVRCPGCKRSFVAPENLNDLRHDPLPRHADGDTYPMAGGMEPEPYPHPPPPPRRPRPQGVGEANEVAPPLPRRRRRRRRPSEYRAAPPAVLVWFANRLRPSTACVMAGGVALVGAIAVTLGVVEMRVATFASPTPQSLTLAQLASRGPGDNAHVKVSDFVTCDNYVYVVRSYPFAPKDRPQIRGWEKVYVPLVPMTPQIRRRLELDPNWRPHAAPGQIRVLVECSWIQNESDLHHLDREPFLRGTVINEMQRLDRRARERLEEAYPGTNFSNCYILQAGRTPASPVRLVLQLVGGTLAAVGAILYAVLVLMYSTRHGE